MEPYINTDRNLYPEKKCPVIINGLPPKEHLRGFRSFLQFVIYTMKNTDKKASELGYLHDSSTGDTFYRFSRDMLKDKMFEEILNILGEYDSNTLLKIIKLNHMSDPDKRYFNPLISLFDDLEGFKVLFK